MVNNMKRKIGSWLLILALAVSQIPATVYADEDRTAPAITSISTDKSQYSVGDTLFITMGLIEEDTGVIDLNITLENTKSSIVKYRYNRYFGSDSGQKVLYTGTHTVEIGLWQTVVAGDYYLQNINFRDQAGNYKSYNARKSSGKYVFDGPNGEIEVPVISIDGPITDITAPILKNVSFDNTDNTVVAGENLNVIMDIEEESKVSYVQLYCAAVGKNISKTFTFEDEDIEDLGNGKYKVVAKVPAKTAKGEWHITSIGIKDNYDYLSTNITDIPYTVFSNYAGDVPEVISSKVVNENCEVKKPGVLNYQLQVKDEDGINLIEVFFDDEERTSGGLGAVVRMDSERKRNDYDTIIDEPIYDDTVTLSVPILNSTKRDTYHVSKIELRDEAGVTKMYSSYYQNLPDDSFTVIDEFNYVFENATDNPNLVSNLESLKDGEAAKILIGKNDILPKAAFDAIKGKDVTMVCYKDAYQWIFNGLDIINETKDVNLKLTFSQIAGEELESTTDAIGLTFEPNGQLPGKATVRFKNDYLFKYLGKENEFHLYYVVGGEFIENETVVDLLFDGEDKWCSFTLDHNSYFVLSPSALKNLTMKNAVVKGYSANYTYSGKTIRPAVAVYFAGQKLKENRDYKYTVSNSKNVGKATISITGIGGYKNTGKTAKNFKVNPKGASIKTPSKAKKAFTAKWKKQSGKMAKTRITGYEVRYSTNSSMSGAKTVAVKGYKKTSKKIKKLKAKKKYYVQVRTYKTVGGVKYYSNWSSKKSVITK